MLNVVGDYRFEWCGEMDYAILRIVLILEG